MATVAAQPVDTSEPVVIPDPRGTTSARILRVLGKAPLNLLLLVIALLWLLPTFALFFTSLLLPENFNSQGWWQILSDPSVATWDNYSNLWTQTSIPHSLVVTLQIAIFGTILPIMVAAFAAYAFAWLEFPGRDWLFIGVIALLVVPLQMALIPIFTLYNKVGHLRHGRQPGALPHRVRAAVRDLPAAELLHRDPEGHSRVGAHRRRVRIRIFFRLILPLGLPAIASLAIFQFLWTWNDLLVALTFGRQTQPITVAIYSNMRQFGSNIDLISPASFLSLAIPLAVFFAFQRYFVQGLLAGSVK